MSNAKRRHRRRRRRDINDPQCPFCFLRGWHKLQCPTRYRARQDLGLRVIPGSDGNWVEREP